MSKQPTRWPIWKITTATVVCALVSPALVWVSALVEKTVEQQASDSSAPPPLLTLSSLIMMLGVAVAMLGVLGVAWLAFRIHRARIPAWKRKSKRKWG